MTGKHDWVILLKFGERQHLEEFRKNGLLFLNNQRYFSALESDPVRADRFEGTDQIHQPKDIKHIRIKNNVDGSVVLIAPEDMAGPISIGFSNQPHYNIYCMFAVSEPIESPLVDERNLAFGDSFVLVLHTQEFVNRVCKAANSIGLETTYGPVEYYNANTYSGNTGPFRKPSTFDYQHEFRFVMKPGSQSPLRLVVGNLTDITSAVHPLVDINRIIDFGKESARKAGI